jgi:hypothetical protein
MHYTVKKRDGVWTVATDHVLLSFDSYGTAVDTAQCAAQVLRGARTRFNQRSLLGETPPAIREPAAIATVQMRL